MSRPFWYLGLTWFAACLIGVWMPLNVLLTLMVGCLLGTVLVLAVSPFRKQRLLLLVVLAATVSFAVQSWMQVRAYLPIEEKVGTVVSLQAEVYEADSHTYLRVTDGDLPVGTRLELWASQESMDVQRYDTLHGTFTLKEYDKSGLLLLRQKASGVCFVLMPVNVTVSRADAPWTAVFTDVRDAAVARIEAHLYGDVAALTAGVCFGANEKLSLQASNDFRACGISHLFSVSGFHMALISQALMALFRRLRFPRIVRGVSIAILLLGFMLIVGLEPSVVRSGVLCLLVLAGDCFRRQADTRNSLGLALLLLLIGDPFAAYDVGLLLSFCATFGLVLLFPKLSAATVSLLPTAFLERHPRMGRWIRRLIDAVCITVAATVATLPISVISFSEISLASVLGNLLAAVPSSALLVFGCLGSLCFPTVLQPLGRVFFFVSGCLSRYLLFITQKISNFLPATVAITDLYLLLWIIGTMGLLWLGYRVARRRGVCLTALVSACALLLSVTAHTWLMRDVTTVQVLAVGRETAILVQSSEHTALICAPETENTVYAVRTALRKRGIDRLDLLVIPCEYETTATNVTLVLSKQLSDTLVLYGEDATVMTAYTKNHQASDGREYRLWEDTALGMYGSFVTLSVGQTRWLFCLREDSVRAVPTAWWLVDTVVFGQRAPSDLALVVSGYGVSPQTRADAPSSYGTQRLVTVGEDDVIMMTRGAGDIDWK